MSKRKYSLKFNQKAYEDINQIFSYIAESLCNGVAAYNLIEKIEKSIMRLRDFPYSCSYVSDDFLKNKGYRKLVVDNYLVFYLVDETEKSVIVMRILYGAQKYQELL